jgi:hypothetical protein
VKQAKELEHETPELLLVSDPTFYRLFAWFSFEWKVCKTRPEIYEIMFGF